MKLLIKFYNKVYYNLTNRDQFYKIKFMECKSFAVETNNAKIDCKYNFRITTLANCWNTNNNSGTESCSNISEPTHSEKILAIVKLMQSQWPRDHLGPTYVTRLTATDPQMIFVALQETTPIGMSCVYIQSGTGIL